MTHLQSLQYEQMPDLKDRSDQLLCWFVLVKNYDGLHRQTIVQ